MDFKKLKKGTYIYEFALKLLKDLKIPIDSDLKNNIVMDLIHRTFRRFISKYAKSKFLSENQIHEYEYYLINHYNEYICEDVIKDIYKYILKENFIIKENSYNPIKSAYGFLEMVDKTAYYLKDDSLIEKYVSFVEKK